MGWEQRKHEHVCRVPDAWKIHRRQAKAGDIWTCWRCKTRWELAYPGIPSTNLIGPGVEPQWIEHGSPEDIWRDNTPPRQTGTDWLYTVEERP